MEGFEVMPALEAAERGDVFVTVTGVARRPAPRALRAHEGRRGAGQRRPLRRRDRPRRAARRRRSSVREVRPLVEQYDLGDRRLNLLARGRVVNLAAAEGHPAAVMDMSFALQALVRRGPRARAARDLAPGVHPVPDAIDREVARLKLAALGVGDRRAHARAGDLPRLLGMSLRVGASGFSFASWRPGFYPAGTRRTTSSPTTPARCATVEINTSFYRLPAAPRRSSAGRPPCPTAFASRSRCRARSRSSAASTTRPAFARACARWATASGRCSCAWPTSASATTASCARCSTASTTTCGARLRPARTRRGTASRRCSRAATRCASTSSTARRRFRYLRLREPPYDDAALGAWADRLRPLLDDGLAVHCYLHARVRRRLASRRRARAVAARWPARQRGHLTTLVPSSCSAALDAGA